MNRNERPENWLNYILLIILIAVSIITYPADIWDANVTVRNLIFHEWLLYSRLFEDCHVNYLLRKGYMSTRLVLWLDNSCVNWCWCSPFFSYNCTGQILDWRIKWFVYYMISVILFSASFLAIAAGMMAAASYSLAYEGSTSEEVDYGYLQLLRVGMLIPILSLFNI